MFENQGKIIKYRCFNSLITIFCRKRIMDYKSGLSSTEWEKVVCRCQNVS